MFKAPLLSLVALAVTMQLCSSAPIRAPVPAAVERLYSDRAEEPLRDVVREPAVRESVPLHREQIPQRPGPEESPPKEVTPAAEEETILREPLVDTVTTEEPVHPQHITDGPIPDSAGEPVPREPAEEELATEDTVFEDALQGETPEEPVGGDAMEEAVEETVREALLPEELIPTVPEEKASHNPDATQQTIPDQPISEQPLVGISTDTTALGETLPQDPVQMILLETSEEEASERATQKDRAAVEGEKNLEESDVPEEAEPDSTDLNDFAPVFPENNTAVAPSDTVTSERVADLERDLPVTLTVAPVFTEDPGEPITVPAFQISHPDSKVVSVSSEAAMSEAGDESVAAVSRGLVLGAAFSALMSLIIIGSVIRAVSRKMR